MTFLSAPLQSSTSFGTTSTYPTWPSLPHEKTHTAGEPQRTLPLYTGTNLYGSQHDLPLPQSRMTSLHQSSHNEKSKEGLTSQGEGGSLRDLLLKSRKSSPSILGTEGRQSVSEQRSSEESMKDIGDRESRRLTAEERPFTTPPQTATPAPRDYPMRSTSMESSTGEVRSPCQSPPSQP